ncbi:MAG TPA: ImmA/IrrE family metallo-endopeptidase [bacterium]|jgi:HTH-type transcriptional regulator/antitoxin HigA
MELKVIKTEGDYQASLQELERLFADPPPKESADFHRLEVLSLLVENYEKAHYHFDLPDPIDAIAFVMEQRGLSRADLEKYIGPRSKVSEILAGKRPLSKRMMRALHEGLGIPAEILLRAPGSKLTNDIGIDWNRFPLNEMLRRGYFQGFEGNLSKLREYAEDLIRPMMEFLQEHCILPVMPRTSKSRIRSGNDIDKYALAAWQYKVVEKAVKSPLQHKYSHEIDEQFIRHVAKLTVLNDGPLAARELMNKYGIHLIIEPHFGRTYLDGAAMMLNDSTPIIGLTLRHNRLDNFWFTLMHELVHLSKHLTEDKSPIIDDYIERTVQDNPMENQADQLAENILLPHWSKEESKAAVNRYSLARIRDLARTHQVDESILAGRIQHDTGNYSRYRRMLGSGIPARMFGVLN